MPKPTLREPYAVLERDLIDTMIAGLKEWRPDLDYPESHSDMAGCVRAVLRKYEVRLRPVPLDRAEICEPRSTCPVCGSVLHDGSTVTELHGSGMAHLACVRRPGQDEVS